MADEEKPTTTVANDSAGNSAGGTPRVFTQEEVDRIVKNVKKSVEKRVDKAFERQEERANPKPEAPKRKELAEADAKLAETKADKSDVADVRREMARMKFENQLLRHGGIREDAAEDLWTLYEVQKPEDVKKWFDAKASLGFAKPTAAKSETSSSSSNAETVKTESAKQAASAPHAPTVSRPTVPTVNGGLVDIWNMTPAELQALGPAGVRAAHEAALSVGKQMHGVPTRPTPGK